MRTSCRVRTCTIAGALFLLPAVARAEGPVQPYPPCDRTPTKGDSAAAEGAFQAGNAAYGEADYDRAINYWEDAYRRDCTAHPMLLNLARAYEINGQKRHAVNALRTYVARNPNSSDEGQIKRRIEKLDEQIQAELAATAPPPPGPAQPPPGGTPPLQPQPGTPPPPPPETAPTGGKRSIAPWILVGVGGVAVIAGVVVFVGANSDIKDFETQCPNRVCPENLPNLASDANAAQTRRTIGGVVAGVGGAAIVGGLVWYFASKPSSSAPATAFVPSIAPGFAGADFVGRF